MRRCRRQHGFYRPGWTLQHGTAVCLHHSPGRYDGAEPTASSLAAANLQRLAHLVPGKAGATFRDPPGCAADVLLWLPEACLPVQTGAEGTTSHAHLTEDMMLQKCCKWRTTLAHALSQRFGSILTALWLSLGYQCQLVAAFPFQWTCRHRSLRCLVFTIRGLLIGVFAT
eukprot:219140-Pelagomonas_calceolata.AAC.10